jgi:hypothetical protein
MGRHAFLCLTIGNLTTSGKNSRIINLQISDAGHEWDLSSTVKTAAPGVELRRRLGACRNNRDPNAQDKENRKSSIPPIRSFWGHLTKRKFMYLCKKSM